MKIQKLHEFFGKNTQDIDKNTANTHVSPFSGNSLNINLGGAKAVDLSGVASGFQVNPTVKADVGAQVNPQVSADGAAVGVGGATSPQAAPLLPEDVTIDGSGQTMRKDIDDSDTEEHNDLSSEDDMPLLTEGRLGELAFGNSLAMSLYEEFYKELTDAIKKGDKQEAQSLLNDFEQDLGALKRQNKRWHKTFIEIQEYLLDNYQKQIDAIPEPEVATHGANVTEDVDGEFEKNYSEAGWDEYDDDYYDLDDVELDRRHAALYGGDRMYCDCGTKRVADEDGYFYCPECEKYE